VTPGEAPKCFATLAALHAQTGPLGNGPVRRTDITSDGYTYESWTTRDEGGQSVIARRGSRYCLIAMGGGVMGIDDIVAAGVPRAIAKRLAERMNRGGR